MSGAGRRAIDPLAKIADAGRWVTPRDRVVLVLLTEHRVATAAQIARVEFPCPNRARVRLEQLAERHYLARWRPYVRPGSAPFQYTVGPLGAALTAAAKQEPIPKPSEVTREAWRLEHSPNLAHRLAVVEFFTRLHGHARTLPGAALAEWWSEVRPLDRTHPPGSTRDPVPLRTRPRHRTPRHPADQARQVPQPGQPAARLRRTVVRSLEAERFDGAQPGGAAGGIAAGEQADR
ncbi:hypothetical protein GCM10023321_80920 [Pseudonocardia eucalypti]|uniref:Uncharacterized protein n=1 Tax=Pseudonocardia eucalypti TaxID=648755 RepID=A0ABP9RDH8_9PSEU|nr:hypothetical protein [Pseudonocardia eucalypti]